MNDYKKEVITAAATQRRQEVMDYQINIDNYRMAIELIGDEVDLQEFKAQLQDLLRTNLIEQRKTQIMLTVMETQLK